MDGCLHVVDLRWDPVHRVVAAEYAVTTIYDRLPALLGRDADEGEGAGSNHASAEMLGEIAQLSNPVVQAGYGQIDLVTPRDRIYGPGTGLIMTAFTFPSRPSRFTDGRRGVFYAGLEEDTAITECAYHLTQRLRANDPGDLAIEHMMLHASLDAEVIDLRPPAPCPPGVLDPRNNTRGQALGSFLRGMDAYGTLYSSVRKYGGSCVAVFRPPALSGCFAVKRVRYHWNSSAGRIVDVEV